MCLDETQKSYWFKASHVEQKEKTVTVSESQYMPVLVLVRVRMRVCFCVRVYLRCLGEMVSL